MLSYSLVHECPERRLNKCYPSVALHYATATPDLVSNFCRFKLIYTLLFCCAKNVHQLRSTREKYAV